MNWIVTALIMGLAGSFHCVGMCSPLVMAATTHNPFLLSKVIYNSGRVLVYGLLGAIAATIGSSWIQVSQQNYLSLAMGIVFLFLGLGIFKRVHIPFLSAGVAHLLSHLRKWFGYWLPARTHVSMWILGMLNGLLPCGLTYMAVASCFILPGAIDGFWFMIVFGLGTWPVMVGITWMATGFIRKISYQRVTTTLFLLTGILLIGRVFWVHQHTVPVDIRQPVAVCK
ncbi:MAG: sulfite exporter TauE/SafE family protein [Bacteroidetes bacterium]|nr:sulfite exporter TauE/SafE family protein [Bacteroidota bacterium]